jgi:hypothetical protein
MSNNKQSSVERFHIKTWALKIQLELGQISIGEYATTYDALLVEAKEMEKEQSQAYAAFCVACDRKKLPLLEFDGWVKLGDEQ